MTIFHEQIQSKPPERVVITKEVRERTGPVKKSIVIEPQRFEEIKNASEDEQLRFTTLLSLCAYNADEVRFEPQATGASLDEFKPGLLFSAGVLMDINDFNRAKNGEATYSPQKYTFTELTHLFEIALRDENLEELVIRCFGKGYDIGNIDKEAYRITKEEANQLSAELLAFASSSAESIYVRNKNNSRDPFIKILSKPRDPENPLTPQTV